jgi:diguanylate cyclase
MTSRDFMEAIAVGAVVHRPDEILYANAEFAALVGDAGFEAAAPRGLAGLTDIDHRARTHGHYQRLLAGDVAPSRHRLQLTLAGGRHIAVECVDQLVEWDGATAIQTLALDIEGCANEHDAAPSSEHRFRTLIEDSVQAIAVRLGRKIVFANQAYAQLFGYADPGEVYALESVEALFADIEGARERLAASRSCRPAERQYEFQALRKDGTT